MVLRVHNKWVFPLCSNFELVLDTAERLFVILDDTKRIPVVDINLILGEGCEGLSGPIVGEKIGMDFGFDGEVFLVLLFL